MHCATILTVFTKYERIHNAEKKNKWTRGMGELENNGGTREEWGKSEKDWGNGPKL